MKLVITHYNFLLQYMYTGEVNLSQDQLASFIETAKSLKIKGIFIEILFKIFSKFWFTLLGIPYDGENLDMLMNFADLSEEQKHQEPIEELFSIKQEVDDPILNEQAEDVEPPQVVYHLYI